MTYTGTISVIARSGGTLQERRYCRISLAADLAKKAGWRAGMPFTVTRKGNTLSIAPAEKSKLSFPPIKGKIPKHSLEFACTHLALGLGKATETDVRISAGGIYIDIPKTMKHGVLQRKRDTTHFIQHPPIIPVVLTFALGTTERAIAMDGLRCGKDIEPVTVPDVIGILTESGRKVQTQGPRLFRLDGETVMLPDVFDAARAVVGKDRQLALIV
ncbi:hypothetical protein CN065_14160 [Sinorhizobium meliloti]|uniref:hypothetical protein n=1 Tax=Rhizobium meliloti TaxID=382 RepID=UPI000B49A9FE|nr:hypothetical protein [Sinorhizobium meliloti]ASP98429.1 hypothetical protein CDO24_13900 [Sinorhizobium meliloti]MQV66174.1 hypothetical protein [Sinorhizobium meliloti]RVQ39336.1 hypothetical protein CN065_14160 [Sinorhizobium meliloti]